MARKTMRSIRTIGIVVDAMRRDVGVKAHAAETRKSLSNQPVITLIAAI